MTTSILVAFGFSESKEGMRCELTTESTVGLACEDNRGPTTAVDSAARVVFGTASSDNESGTDTVICKQSAASWGGEM